MSEATAEWLALMLDELGWRADAGRTARELMARAKMPGVEADTPKLNRLAAMVPGDGNVDWVRFGQLLRDYLGWADYPTFPSA